MRAEMKRMLEILPAENLLTCDNDGQVGVFAKNDEE